MGRVTSYLIAFLLGAFCWSVRSELRAKHIVPAQTYNVDAAHAAGLSDDDILDYLRKARPNYDVDGALKAGVSKQDIIRELAEGPSPQAGSAAKHGAPPQRIGISDDKLLVGCAEVSGVVCVQLVDGTHAEPGYHYNVILVCGGGPLDVLWVQLPDGYHPSSYACAEKYERIILR